MDDSNQEQAEQQAAPQEAAPAREKLASRLTNQVRRIAAPIPGKIDSLKRFIIECKRVLRITKKPDKQEFTTIVKISSIGMALIGLIGFIVFFLKEVLI